MLGPRSLYASTSSARQDVGHEQYSDPSICVIISYATATSCSPLSHFPFPIPSKTVTPITFVSQDVSKMISYRSCFIGLAVHTLLWVGVVSDSRTCYFPDHTEATNFTECNASATESSCCRNSEACLSNGYCLQQAGLANRITRGACTDSTFSNPGCPSLCTDGKMKVTHH